MKINDYDRISSFMNELAGVELDVRPLQKRMLDCEMPGTYDVDFVGVTFEKMRLLSMTVYLLASEPSADERMYQRLAAYEYLSSILPRVSFEGAFVPDGVPLRVDPSFKSSDKDTILRLETMYYYYNRKAGNEYVEKLIDFVFPSSKDIVKRSLLGYRAPSRTAMEIDRGLGAGRKLRLYYRPSDEDEAILEGISVNESGTVSTRKSYFCVDGDFSWRLPNRKFLNPKDFGMEVHYRASEQSDYGADYKLYFVNRPKSA